MDYGAALPRQAVRTINDYSELTDGELANCVRAGDNRAFGVLWRRHEREVLATARRFVSSPYDAEDVRQDVALGLLSAFRSGSGPQEDRIKSYLFTSVKHTAFNRIQRTTREVPTPDDGLELPASDSGYPDWRGAMVVRAFKNLPDRWRNVIEATVIQGFRPHEVSAGVGLTGNGTSALALRAREGLRQAYLMAHVKPATEERCEKVIEKMPLYVRGNATPRNRIRIEVHVAEHPDCARKLEEMRRANELLPRMGSPLRSEQLLARPAAGAPLVTPQASTV